MQLRGRAYLFMRLLELEVRALRGHKCPRRMVTARAGDRDCMAGRTIRELMPGADSQGSYDITSACPPDRRVMYWQVDLAGRKRARRYMPQMRCWFLGVAGLVLPSPYLRNTNLRHAPPRDRHPHATTLGSSHTIATAASCSSVEVTYSLTPRRTLKSQLRARWSGNQPTAGLISRRCM